MDKLNLFALTLLFFSITGILYIGYMEETQKEDGSQQHSFYSIGDGAIISGNNLSVPPTICTLKVNATYKDGNVLHSTVPVFSGAPRELIWLNIEGLSNMSIREITIYG